MKYKNIFIVIVLSVVTTCGVRESDFSSPKIGDAVFYAKNGDLPETKTVLQSDGAIKWCPNDQINLFYGASAFKFKSTNTQDALEVEFHGSLDGIQYNNEEEFWAVYPYNDNNSFDGESVYVNLPAEQFAVDGSFADDLYISLAKTNSDELQFYNLCGGVKFSIQKTDIKSVTFKGNNGEILAGNLSVIIDSDGHPIVKEVNNGFTEISLSANDGGCLETNKWYYIVTIPVELKDGYTLTFNTSEGAKGHKTSNAPVIIKRSIWGELTSADKMIPEAIDLGLSVKWAASNLGANSETRKGSYYSWAETSTKSTYNDETYEWWDYSNSTYSIFKYVINDSYSYVGSLDYRYVLEPEDDAATVMLGGDWRIPTKAEIKELIDNCEWTWQESYNGVSGYLVRSKVEGYTNNTIFLPLTGFKYQSSVDAAQNYGIYWGANLYERETRSAWGLIAMDPDYYSSNYSHSSINVVDTQAWTRTQGATIRPVFGKRKDVTSINLSKTSLEIGKGQNVTISAALEPEDAPGFGIIWKSSNESVATVSDASNIDTYSHSLKAIINAVNFGETTIIAESVDSGVQAVCRVIVTEPQPVDLGLSIMWGSINIGAGTNKDAGNNQYNWEENDIAQFELGDKWRLPTYSEAIELIDPDKCNWSWVSNGSKDTGYEVISLINGESIFLSRMSTSNTTSYYLTSTKDNSNVYYLFFDGTTYKVASDWSKIDAVIRPVYDSSIIPITRIILDPTEMEIELGKSASLNASLIPSDATYSSIPIVWTSSDNSVATVDNAGVVSAIGLGKAVITGQTCGGISACCTINVTYPIPETIDLGLSVKWASANVGAINNYDYGSLFAWGETTPKSSYSWSNYKWCNGDMYSITKYYCRTDGEYWGGEDNPDMKSVLETEDDAATLNLGTGWRTPTCEELYELVQNCTWTQHTINKVKGFKVTSKVEGYTDSWIFIPCESAYYWASTLGDSWTQYYADCLYVSYSSSYYSINRNIHDRSHGTYVRPVYDM